MPWKIAAVLCWVVGAFAAAAQDPAAAPRFPIIAWMGVPAEQTSIERYRELADCGFTHSFTGFPNADAVARALDVAQQTGVKLLIQCPELSADPEAIAKRFMSHPALGGYYLRDEPNAADFAGLAKWMKRIQSADDRHPCIVNLFPTYATPGQLGTKDYREHVERFVKEVPSPLISFDHYPIVGDRVRGDWMQNLEIIRAASAQSGRPFWAFCLSVAHDPYPIPTIEHLRLQAHSNLAYGAQGIQYFTYWTPADTRTWNFHEGPITADGKRTRTYDVVKQANREIQALAPLFLGARVMSVAHAGEPLPAGTRKYEPAAPIRALEVEGGGVIISSLAKDDRRYLVVVNRDLRRKVVVKIAADPAVRIEVAFAPAEGAHPLSKTLEPGEIHILQWPAK